jgi:zinc transporter 1
MLPIKCFDSQYNVLFRYKDKNARKLVIMSCLTTSFMVAEFTFGFVTNSLALMADAFHMLSDQLALLVGFISIQVIKQ